METTLTLNHSILRQWRPSDAASLVKHANNPNVARNLRDIFPNPYTPADAVRWFEISKTLLPGSHFAIEVEGEAAGGIDVRFPDQSQQIAEIGFWLGEQFWRRGIMSEIVPVFTRHVFQTFPVHEIYATVFSWNEGSRRLLQKSGFRNTGLKARAGEKAGKKVDVYEFRLTR